MNIRLLPLPKTYCRITAIRDNPIGAKGYCVLDLHLPPEIERSLWQHAAIVGMDIEKYAIKVIASKRFANITVLTPESAHS